MADSQADDLQVDLKALVAREISAADTDGAAIATKRTKALEYYQGKMDDVKSEPGRSSVVSMDLADTMGWMLPGIMRVFTASDHMAVAEPVTPEDEDGARQATDGINYTFWKENDGYRIVHSGTWDSLLGGNGIIKSWWDDTPRDEVTFHSGLTADEYALLLEPDEDGNEAEVMASTEREQVIELPPDPATGQPSPPQTVTVYDCKLKRRMSGGCTKVEALPPEDYGIDGDAKTCADARFQYHRSQKTRSELLEMGFDKVLVESLSKTVGNQDSQQAARDPHKDSGDGDKSTDLIDLYECYMRVDIDGDGISEMCRVYYGGPPNSGELLDWEVWEDETPFDDIPCDPMPHRWDARSIYDETNDVQRVKTVLKRNALDNIYATNNPQRFVTGEIKNPEELFSPSFGGTVFGKTGATVEPLAVAFVADRAYDALNYEDQVIQQRTGVSRQTMALDPDSLQNQTATAVQAGRDASYSQIELIARNQAELGWSKVFRKILRLEIKHQDKPRTIRMRGKFVNIDPRSWNADMDVSINVGLGTGSRDRDMQMLQTVLASQISLTDRLSAGGFGDKALDMLPYIHTTLVKSAEAAGIKNPEMFYPDVTPQDIAAGKQRLQQMQGQTPLPLQIQQAKSQADAQIAQMKAQSEQAVQQSEMQSNQIKAQAEIQKSQADTQVKSLEAQMAQQKAQMDAELAQAQLQIKQLEISAKQQTERWKAELVAATTLKAAEISAGHDQEAQVLEAALESQLGIESHQQEMERAALAHQHSMDQQAAAPPPAAPSDKAPK